MTMRPLPAADLVLLHDLWDELAAGDTLTPERWATLNDLQPRFAAALDVAGLGPSNAFEPFALIRDGADAPPLIGPRWWFHLLGLRHGAAHVILLTPQGWFIAQRRSRLKDDAPGAIDVAVTGHSGTDDPLAGAWRELAEEVGLGPARDGASPSLVGDALTYFCTYDVADMSLHAANPPTINRERLTVYHAQLTAEGMARLRFADDEVTSLLLLGPDDARLLAERCTRDEIRSPGELDLALGIRGTLPRWIAAHDDSHAWSNRQLA